MRSCLTWRKRRWLVAKLSECEYLLRSCLGASVGGEITLKRYDVGMMPSDKRIAEFRVGLAGLRSSG